MRNSAGYLRIFLSLFIVGILLSKTARLQPIKHAVKQSSSSSKQIKSTNKKGSVGEELKKTKEQEEEADFDVPDLPPAPENDPASTLGNPSSGKPLLVLIACLLALPLIPAIVTKKYSGNSRNRIRIFLAWFKENKESIQSFYLVGIVVILFGYMIFFNKDEPTQKAPVKNVILEKYMQNGFKKVPKQKMNTVDSIH
jgi:hypothetical protein